MRRVLNMFWIFAAFFLLPVIFLTVEMVQLYNYNGILKRGIEVEAEVVPNSMSSSTSSNGESFYSVAFTFVDEEGIEHRGRTSESYTYEFANLLEDGGTILIKYDPKTFDAVESNYDSSMDKGGQIVKILFFAFFAVDFVLWAVAITLTVKKVKRYRIAMTGTKYSAEVISIDSNVRVNGVDKYKITFTWTSENGEFTDTTPSNYTFHQAYALQLQKHIEIRAVGNKGVIMTQPNLEYLREMPDHNNY